MKFRKLTLALALSAMAATASATIVGAGSGNTAANNAELLLVIWSPTTQSNYVQDLGLTISAFRASGSTLGYSFSAPMTSIYSSSTLAAASDARWAVVAYDSYGDPVPDGEGDNLSLLTTVSRTSSFSAATPGMSGDQLQNGTTSWANWTLLTNQRGTHPTLANGSSLVTVQDGPVYWLDPSFGPAGNYGGNFAYSDGNAVGTSSSFYRLSPTDIFDTSLPVTVQRFGTTTVAGQWLFNGTTVTYNVGAVPEPGTYALLAAGLAFVGFVAARRRA